MSISGLQICVKNSRISFLMQTLPWYFDALIKTNNINKFSNATYKCTTVHIQHRGHNLKISPTTKRENHLQQHYSQDSTSHKLV